MNDLPNYHYPDARGHFGPYGGSFTSETLTQAIIELREAYAHYQNDPEFIAEFEREVIRERQKEGIAIAKAKGAA